MSEPKKYYLSQSDKKVAGVCGGLAKYFNVDPTLVRLVTVLLALITAIAPVVITYIVVAIIAPQEPESENNDK